MYIEFLDRHQKAFTAVSLVTFPAPVITIGISRARVAGEWIRIMEVAGESIPVVLFVALSLWPYFARLNE